MPRNLFTQVQFRDGNGGFEKVLTHDDGDSAIKAVLSRMPEITIPVLDSRSIFTDNREIIILHGSQEYRLRVTKQDKLILTK
jgi:hemin uptake protein HemP